jgi:hypothetical protein
MGFFGSLGKGLRKGIRNLFLERLYKSIKKEKYTGIRFACF